MGSIRKQTIISSIVVYIGFFIGAFNQYFFVKNGSFTADQYGLTRIFFDVLGPNIYIFASLGTIPVIYKFYPYYKSNLEDNKIDLVSWALLVSVIGFTLVLLAGIYFQPFFVAKYGERSKLLMDYYYWAFPFAIGLLFYSVLESFCWALHKTVITSFLKETFLRLLTMGFILLFYFKFISFESFMHLFSFLYVIVFLVLLAYLIKEKKLHFTLSPSIVTKKFWKKMVGMQVYIFGGTCINTIAATIDSLIIASVSGLGLKSVGVFGFSQYAANLVQVPQRSIQAATTGIIANAWREKNFAEINRIYQRSSINLLLMALFIFGNVCLNTAQGLEVLNIRTEFNAGINVIFVLGLARIIDAGTGVNGTIIGTSTKWKFDFWSGVILLTVRIPLTWYLIKNYGIIGSAFSDVFSYALYNFVRFEFLRRKYNMQPFTVKTLYAITIGVAAYSLTYFLFNYIHGWGGIILRSILFSSIMIASIILLKLTPDAQQMWEKWRTKN